MKNYDVLNELVPKTQELHREIFDKGYEQGFKDGTNAEYEYDHAVVEAYNDGRTFILDKIRTDVMSLTNGDTPERIWNVNVLNIIDKYKPESEK